jgi:hypothetical protein
MRATHVRQAFYGVAAGVGLVGTWLFNLRYTGSVPYLEAWFANAASSSAAVDLLVVFVVVGAVFMTVEGRRVGLRLPWLYGLLSIPTAFALMFPLFLLVRERALDRQVAAPAVPA